VLKRSLVVLPPRYDLTGTVDQHEDPIVDTVQAEHQLPSYLKRYLTTRYSNLVASRDDPEMVTWALEDRHRRGLVYLRETMEFVTHASLPTSDLIRRVPALPGDPTASLVVTEILNRVPRLTIREQDEVLTGLLNLLDDSQWLPTQRVIIDRALQRLLWHFRTVQAFALAARCVVSPRTIRRQAAYRFYLRHGLDDSARALLVQRFDEAAQPSRQEDELYRQVITTDPTLVARRGVRRVLEVAPNAYWRRRVIEGVLGWDVEAAMSLAEDYPQELVWAIREQRRSEMAGHVLNVLMTHQDDPYLMNRIIQCLAELGDAPALEVGRRVARRLLSQAADD